MTITNNSSVITTDHKKIQTWIKQKNGKPAVITANEDHIEGLRVDFEGKEDDKYLSHARVSKNVPWNKFFQEFERLDLAFIFLPTLKRNPDMAYRFIKRQNTEELIEVKKEEETAQKIEQFQTSLGVFENGSVETPLTAYEINQEESQNKTLRENFSPEVRGEQEVSGSTPDPSVDDDTTSFAKRHQILLSNDPQAKT